MPTGRLKILEYKTTRIFERNSETEGLFFWFWWGFFSFFTLLHWGRDGSAHECYSTLWLYFCKTPKATSDGVPDQCKWKVAVNKFSWLKGITEEWKSVLLPITKSTLSMCLIALCLMCLIQLVSMCLNLTNCLEEDSAASKMEVYFGYMICSSDPK